MAAENPPIASTGLTVILDPKEADLDIVFVHGFKGHPERTWSCKVGADADGGEPPNKVRKQGFRPFSTSRKDVYWPRDLLPRTFPDARVLTYGYDTNIRHIAGKPICKSTVYDIAGDFLVELEARRRLDPQRRLLFIAHSLGGIVVKEMLRRSSSFQHARQAHLREVCNSTIGVMFFGTPHQGADPRRLLQKVAESLAKVVGFTANQQVVDTLLPSSERLRELRDEFGPMAQLQRWTIHSFQEALGVLALENRKVVDDTSSYINLPDVETTQHIGRNHMEMCRFTGLSDIEFTKVEAALHRMIDNTRASHRPLRTTDLRGHNVKQDIISALRFERVDFRRTAIKAAHKKTCSWLLQKQVYIDWLDLSKIKQHCGFLWIKGKPGTGKSTLMKFALTNTQRSRKDRVSISFFFNARGSHLERSTRGMYRSLLAQLLERTPDKKAILYALSQLSFISNDQGAWSIEALKEVFQQVILQLGRTSVVCFIDALDECDEHEIRDMVSFFENLSEFVVEGDVQFLVCLASRHYPHISISRGQSLVLEATKEHQDDITEYIESKLKMGDSTLAQKIRSDLREKASAVFMWVVLVVDILNKEYDSGRIHKLRARLAELPGDLHGLFRDIITRDSHNIQELLHCIQWVLFASRPLSPQELYYALLFETEELGSISPDDITVEIQQRYILDTSKGLTEIIPAKKPKEVVVQFIHESVRDFFLTEGGLAEFWPSLGDNIIGASHERLRQTCEAYIGLDLSSILNFGLFVQMRQSRWKHTRKSALAAFPLIQYATQNLLIHGDKAQDGGITQQKFLANFPRQRWLWLSNLFERHEIRRYERHTSLLYILAEKDLDHLIPLISDQTGYLEELVARYPAPFIAAMANGSHRVIQKFLELEIASRPEIASLGKLYDLYRSRGGKHPKCSRDLRVDHMYNSLKQVMWDRFPNHDGLLLAFMMTARRKGDYGDISLDLMHLITSNWQQCIEYSESLAAVGLLTLENVSADVYGMALNLSLKLGATDLARAILDLDAVFPIWDEFVIGASLRGGTDSLRCASVRLGKLTIPFSDLDSCTTDYNTGDSLLLITASVGDKHFLRFLIATGKFDVTRTNHARENCLHLAAKSGDVETLDILLACHETSRLLNHKDGTQRTALHNACYDGHHSVIKRLLAEKFIDTSIYDNNGHRPLHITVINGDVDGTKLLLDSGKVDVNAEVTEVKHSYIPSRTALLIAVERNDCTIVRLLIEKGMARLGSNGSAHREHMLLYLKEQGLMRLLFYSTQ